MGGILPTICKLTAIANTDPAFSFSAGHFTVMAGYFVIGVILCAGLQEKKLRQAFVLGICAPGIVTSYISGLPPDKASSTSTANRISWSPLPINTAHAGTDGKGSNYLRDVREALGFRTQQVSPLTGDWIVDTWLEPPTRRPGSHIASIEVRSVVGTLSISPRMTSGRFLGTLSIVYNGTETVVEKMTIQVTKTGLIEMDGETIVKGDWAKDNLTLSLKGESRMEGYGVISGERGRIKVIFTKV
jgi:hypothetical protein